MTRSVLILFLAILAPLARAADREPYPSDYKPHPCAPAKGCKTWNPSEFVQAGARLQAYTLLKQAWVTEHWTEMETAIAPYCAKLATCYATRGNTYLFCDDTTAPSMVQVCEKYEKGSPDHEQCVMFVRTYATGLILNSFEIWKTAQACANATPAPQELRKLDVWMLPATLPLEFNGKFMIRAIDAETRVPVQANVTIGDEDLFADTPGGRPMTGYAVKWKTKLVPVKNAQGRTDFVPPQVRVEAAGYEPFTFPLPVEPRRMVVETTMPIAKLKPGKHSVTFTVRDSATGKPVDARVMLGGQPLGEANQPLELEVKRGEKRREIWVKSLFSLYSDVVVAPANE